MPTHNEFGVNLDALADAEKGIRTAAQELGEMAGWKGLGHAGAQGKGLVEGLDLGPETVGHEALALALTSFGENWTWGIQYLVDDGMDAAEALGETRSTYQQIEDAVTSTLKQVTHAFVGDPSESHDVWADKSWGQIAAESMPTPVNNLVEQTTGQDLTGDGHIGGDLARKLEEIAGAELTGDGKVGEQP